MYSWIKSFSLTFLAVAGLPSLAMVQPDSKIQTKPHDEIVPIKYNVPHDSFMFKFQPVLDIAQGCDVYPAVDAQGFISGGLNIGGLSDGDCGPTIGQTYVRKGHARNLGAIMYAWYFPKKQELTPHGWTGHRHSWASVIVWVDTLTPAAQIQRISLSRDTPNYYTTTSSGWSFHGTSQHPYVAKGYERLEYTHGEGPAGFTPLLNWDFMPQPAKDALNAYMFGHEQDEHCPFSDEHFQSHLEAAYVA